MQNSADVALVSGRTDDRTRLEPLVKTAGLQLVQFSTAFQLKREMANREIPIVIARTNFADGNWKRLLNDIGKMRNGPLLLVLADGDDVDLWVDVLNNGGFDVITTPLRRDVALPAIQSAWNRWSRRKDIEASRRTNPAASAQLPL